MSYRSVVLGVMVVFVVPACGGGSSTPIAAGATSTIAPPATSSTVPPTTAAPSTTSLRATSTRPPSTTATTRAAPTTQATSPTTTSTVPAARTVSRGSTFSVSKGETVTVLGEGLSVTYASAGADGRCRPGQQCLVAGDATVSVTVRKDGTPAATLVLHTDSPSSAPYAGYTVELVLLGFGSPSVATLRVT